MMGYQEVNKTIRWDAAAGPGQDIVQRIRRGHRTAFRKLVESYQSKVFSIVYGILHNPEDTQDIAQQVFTKVFSAINSFDGGSLVAWICKIAINECCSHLRKCRTKVALGEQAQWQSMRDASEL